MTTADVISNQGKPFLANIITAILYTTVVGGLLSAIGGLLQVANANDIAELGAKIASYDPMAIITGIIALIIIGVFVWVFSWVNAKLKALLSGKKGTVKLNKRPAVLAFAGAGLLFTFLFYSLNAMFSAFGGAEVNVLDGQTLLSAVLQFRVDIIIVSLVGLGIVGWLIGLVGKHIPDVSESLPHTITKV